MAAGQSEVLTIRSPSILRLRHFQPQWGPFYGEDARRLAGRQPQYKLGEAQNCLTQWVAIVDNRAVKEAVTARTIILNVAGLKPSLNRDYLQSSKRVEFHRSLPQ